MTKTNGVMATGAAAPQHHTVHCATLMKSAISWVILLLAFSACHHTTSHRISPQQQFIVSTNNVFKASASALKIANSLKNNGLLVIPTNTFKSRLALPPVADYEQLWIWPPGGMSDGYNGLLYINHKTFEYWILRTGGIGGTFELFGPMPYEE
jgi:hypothetical protein